MFKRIRKAILRIRLRLAVSKYMSICDEYDCGFALASYISTRLCDARDKVMRLKAQLEALE